MTTTKKKVTKKRAQAKSRPRQLVEIDENLQKRQFLEAFVECGRVDLATKRVGIIYRAPYDWSYKDEKFKKDFEEARELATQRLEDAAYRRACTGYLKPVYHRGALVGMERVYSDSLTMFLLKGMKPEKYRERHSYEVGGNGRPLDHTVSHGLSDELATDIRQKILGLE